MIDSNNLPKHIGIIMDGNRRWAKKHHLPIGVGHSKGAETFKKLAIYCNKIGIENVTFYAFSTENWKRSESEVSALMSLFKKYINDVLNKFGDENIKIKFIGDISKFPEDIKKGIENVESKTASKTGLNLSVAVNYGSRAEITKAAREISEKVLAGGLKPEEITEETVGEHLYTKDLPDLDLVIRTAGEQRLSNFLLWQAAYSEFYFSEVLWPDFDEKEFDKAIENYLKRTRKFGGQ
ncbi:MAG: isoprenyl transferase [Clostridia bacterium]|nr:isoprenyl transferase [Clostridia bacterium]